MKRISSRSITHYPCIKKFSQNRYKRFPQWSLITGNMSGAYGNRSAYCNLISLLPKD
jgi:hypothetical protein